jgi:hypothetical protein
LTRLPKHDERAVTMGFRRIVETTRAEAAGQSAAQSPESRRLDSGPLRSTIPPDRLPIVRRSSAREAGSSKSRQQIPRHVDRGDVDHALEARTVNGLSRIAGSRRTVALESHPRLVTGDVETDSRATADANVFVGPFAHCDRLSTAATGAVELAKRNWSDCGGRRQFTRPELLERLRNAAPRHGDRSVGPTRRGGDRPIAMCPEKYIDCGAG